MLEVCWCFLKGSDDAVEPVIGVTEFGYDVFLVVELFVQGCRHDCERRLE